MPSFMSTIFAQARTASRAIVPPNYGGAQRPIWTPGEGRTPNPRPHPMDYYKRRRVFIDRPRGTEALGDDSSDYETNSSDLVTTAFPVTDTGYQPEMGPPISAMNTMPQPSTDSGILGKIFAGFGQAIGTGVTQYSNLKTKELLANQRQKTAVAQFNASTYNPIGGMSTGTLLILGAIGLGAYLMLGKK